MQIIWETGDYATVADDIRCGDLAARDIILERKVCTGVWQARSNDWDKPIHATVREEWLKP